MSASKRPTVYHADNEIVILGDDGLPWNERVAEWQILSDVNSPRCTRGKGTRPKKYATHRSIVIEAMSHYRFEGSNLEAFLGAAKKEEGKPPSIDRITITPMDDKPMRDKSKKYMVDCEDILPPRNPEKEVSLGTLYEWWGEAKIRR